MESVKVDGSKYGVDEIFQVEQLDGFKPAPSSHRQGTVVAVPVPIFI